MAEGIVRVGVDHGVEIQVSLFEAKIVNQIYPRLDAPIVASDGEASGVGGRWSSGGADHIQPEYASSGGKKVAKRLRSE
ncbi:MAG: hypothetical protein CME15_07800 [Gemmatimonadetes bacterium]|nr:hypothetical protein [Gemmatimonadota bacterium]